MPDRPMSAVKLDDISMKLGELTAYTHQHRHEVKNVGAKIDGLQHDIGRQVAALRAEIRVDMETFNRRLTALETLQNQQTGAKNLAAWVLQSPLFAWVAAAVVVLWAWISRDVG